MFFQEGVAVLVEFGESDDGDALGEGAVHNNSTFLQLTFGYLIC